MCYLHTLNTRLHRSLALNSMCFFYSSRVSVWEEKANGHTQPRRALPLCGNRLKNTDTTCKYVCTKGRGVKTLVVYLSCHSHFIYSFCQNIFKIFNELDWFYIVMNIIIHSCDSIFCHSFSLQGSKMSCFMTCCWEQSLGGSIASDHTVLQSARSELKDILFLYGFLITGM